MSSAKRFYSTCKMYNSNQSCYRLALWEKFSADDILKYFSYFSKKTGFDISCKLSPICMKCQILFPAKNKKNITNLLSAELAKRVVEVKAFAVHSLYILSYPMILWECRRSLAWSDSVNADWSESWLFAYTLRPFHGMTHLLTYRNNPKYWDTLPTYHTVLIRL